jgi:hypothetical protein
MSARIALSLLVIPCLLWIAPRQVEPLAPDRDLATLAPRDSAVWIEAPGLADLARRGVEHPVIAAALAEPRIAALLAEGKLDPRTSLAALDQLAGFEVLPTVAEFAERGAGLAIAFRRAEPSLLLLLRGADARRVGERTSALLALAAERAGFPGALDEPAARVLDADLWRLGDHACVARRDALALVSNDESFLRDALELAADADELGLAGTELAQRTISVRRGGEIAFGFADLTAVDRRAERGELGDADGWTELRSLPTKPEVQLLFGPHVAAFGAARGVAFALACEREDVRLSAIALGVDVGSARMLFPEPGAAFAPVPIGRPNGASWLVHRDLVDLFARRAEIFPASDLPAFAEALANLSLFFGGTDVAETVIPALGPWARVVVREVEFDPRAIPEIRLPAAALVARVKDAAATGPQLSTAFQTIVGLSNVERGQRSQPPLQAKIELIGDVQVDYARLLPPKPGDGVDLAYNLEPACALCGDLFVIGTHRKLVEELVRELAAGKVDATAPTGERLEVTGDAVRAALETNRAALVGRATLRDGKPRASAERDVGAMLALAALVDRLVIDARCAGERRVAFDVTLDLAARKE